MHTSKMMFRYSATAVALSLLIPGILFWFYWEFAGDADVDQEIAFYTSIMMVPDSENALYSLVGVHAPLDTENIREWGKQALTRYKEGPRIGGEQSLKIKKNTGSESPVRIETGGDTKHYVCWFPGKNLAADQKGCMDEAGIREYIRLNQIVMRRYQQAFQYQSLYYELDDNYSIQSTIGLTKLAVIDYWLRRNDLSPAEVDSIVEMMRFWERVIDEGNHSLVGLAIALVNYGLSSNLVTHLSEIDPGILMRYHQLFGNFYEKPVDSDFIETIAKHEFRMLNSELCFLTHYRDRAVDCRSMQYATGFKPNRTIRILYDQRLKQEDCNGPKKRSWDADTDDWLFWVKIFSRPGNFRGRTVAVLLSNGMTNSCEIFKNLAYKVKSNQFRNFYLSLKRQGISAEQLDGLSKANKDLFRVGESDQYYVWDFEKESLVYTNDLKMSYTIPY
ncbi:MAG: hypothetical protein GY785_20750 [Gammaproteobacteria bacterium]|nr:hypothetical protein [Gammaproteobacteria bacterium]